MLDELRIQKILSASEAKRQKCSPISYRTYTGRAADEIFLKLLTTPVTVEILLKIITHELLSLSSRHGINIFARGNIPENPSNEIKNIEELAENFKELDCKFRDISKIAGNNSELLKLIERAIILGYNLGHSIEHIKFIEHMQAAGIAYSLGARSKNDQKRWADRLETVYLEQPQKLSDKTRKSNALATVIAEYEAETKKEAPKRINDTFREWWKKHYPLRFND
jgi:hypothetical protein